MNQQPPRNPGRFTAVEVFRQETAKHVEALSKQLAQGQAQARAQGSAMVWLAVGMLTSLAVAAGALGCTS